MGLWYCWRNRCICKIKLALGMCTKKKVLVSHIYIYIYIICDGGRRHERARGERYGIGGECKFGKRKGRGLQAARETVRSRERIVMRNGVGECMVEMLEA